MSTDVPSNAETERGEPDDRAAALESYQRTVIEDLKGKIDRLAAGDLTIDPSVPEPAAEFEEITQVHAEFEEMSAKLGRACDNIGGVVGDVTDLADDLADTSQSMSATSQQVSSSVEEIDAS